MTRGKQREAAPEIAAPVRRRRWGQITVVAVALLAVAGVTAATALGLVDGGDAGTQSVSNLPPGTTEVTTATLVATEELNGSLGYGDAAAVAVFAGGAEDTNAGVITGLPGVGDTIQRGEQVYSVNAEPVVLMYGAMPFFRNLSVGDTGSDVEQLEANLSELGYADFTVDTEYTPATADAVAAWQEDVGLPETGRFDPARATVTAGAIRIAELGVPLGSAASGEILLYTGTERQVTVQLEVADQQLVEEDMPLTVTLPDGTDVPGTVSEIGTVLTAGTEPEAGDAGQEQQGQPATFQITIAVDNTEMLGDWETAPVEVLLETERREDVLAVPVSALVALAEGGYGVQVVAGESTHYAAVDLGLFADGMVEVTGDEIAEGMVVGVPAS